MAAAKTVVTINYDSDASGMPDVLISVTLPDNEPTGPTDEVYNTIRHLLSLVAVKSHAGRAFGPVDEEIVNTKALLTAMGCIVA